MNITNERVMSFEQNTILLIEDDPNDIILIKRAFTKANIANPIHVVEDGEEAIAYLAGKGQYTNKEKYPLPILILLDLKIPRKSGHEVLEWLRSQPGLKRLTVVVLTSSQQINDINRAYDLGANSYLVKPVTFDRLLDMVKALNFYWFILNENPEVKSE
ncbi:MAG: response regulator [Thermodesulfobacteriota bacterium]|nr:response regulator [Thermodesulfobacteriota bacterium]